MRINLLQLGTEGVDMKTNPLLLGNKKLHAATNLIFDEGVIRTRPGFRYARQKAAGQFQGAGEFRPRLGISSGKMSNVAGGIVIVAGGEVWSGCTLIGDGFFCKGDVNVFQAENYLILQCLETPTYWWDGVSGLMESPGMNEQDWRDPETPVQELEIEVPVADTPACEIEAGITVTFNVIDSATEEVVSGALITVFQNGNRAYQGTSNSFGKYQIKPLAGAYTYSVVAEGYPGVDNAEFVAGQTLVEYEFDDCVAPMMIESGETEVNVRLAKTSLIANRLTVVQVCNSNGLVDDNFDVFINNVYVGALALGENAQVGSVFIGSVNPEIELTEPDFTCPVENMIVYRFNETILSLGNNTLRMVNTQSNGNGNVGTVEIRSYLNLDGVLSDPLVITNLEYYGASGLDFEFNFDYVDPT